MVYRIQPPEGRSPMPSRASRIISMAFIALTLVGCGGKPDGGDSESQPSLGDTHMRSSDGMVMVYVPSGEFIMGSDEEEVALALDLCWEYTTNCAWSYFSGEMPEHSVLLDGFWLDKTEVTVDQLR
jgi:formylglycine-generating enzyme required for sulfatase activity